MWILDNLVRILIRIHGSVPLTYGSGSGSCRFRQWLPRCLLVGGSTQIRTYNDGSGSGRPKNIRIQRIRIHNACFDNSISKPRIETKLKCFDMFQNIFSFWFCPNNSWSKSNFFIFSNASTKSKQNDAIDNVFLKGQSKHFLSWFFHYQKK